jgi:hypothetical protein
MSLCSAHQVAATGVCARCGRFGCAACLSTVSGEPWCSACLARPEARLTPSPEAKRALLAALLGFHGIVVLLPVAAWLALRELERIKRRDAPEAGKPWAHGALAISVLGLAGWALLLLNFGPW